MKPTLDEPKTEDKGRKAEETREPAAGMLTPAEEPAIEAPPALERRVFQPRTLLGFVIALAALYFFYKRGFDLDFREVWARMRMANGPILLLAVAVYYTSFVFRALRWEALLANVGYSRKAGVPMPSTLGLGEIIYLSWFANCVTVARLGDAYRGYMLKRAAGVSFTVTMGTILAERLIDVVVLAGMMAVSALVAFRGVLPPEAERALIGGLVLAGVGLLGLASLRRLRPIFERLLPARLYAIYRGVESGVTGSFRRIPLLTGYSVIGWIIEASTLYLTAVALDAPLSPVGALVVALVASLLTTIPFTPAGLGVTEAGMVLVLTRLGLDPNAAGAVALLNRVINYWSIVVFGALLYVFSRKK
jgi:glycosyltransferase 2 family protein